MPHAEFPPEEPNHNRLEEDIDWQPQEVPPIVEKTATSLVEELLGRFYGASPNPEGVTDEATLAEITAYRELTGKVGEELSATLLGWLHEATVAMQRIGRAKKAAEEADSKNLEDEFLGILAANNLDPADPTEES